MVSGREFLYGMCNESIHLRYEVFCGNPQDLFFLLIGIHVVGGGNTGSSACSDGDTAIFSEIDEELIYTLNPGATPTTFSGQYGQ